MEVQKAVDPSCSSKNVAAASEAPIKLKPRTSQNTEVTMYIARISLLLTDVS